VNRSITPKGLRTIFAIVFVGTIFILLSQRYGPRAQQAENMARATQHISILRPILDKDFRFTHIRLTSYTAANGSLLVSGDLSSDQDLDALRRTVEGSNVPVEVVYQVSTATP
jgi:hypothetical protein